MLIRLCRRFFFLMKREKTIWFNTLGDFFFLPPLLVKENYSLHPLREKSIIPNKSLSCCPALVVLSRTLGNVDFVSYALLDFFLKARMSGKQ